MTERRLMGEWPLAVFTLALQLACGFALAANVQATSRTVPHSVLRPFAMSIFPIVSIALLASLLHLGRPLSAWRALSNIRNSRLSLEVLLTALFAAAALVYSCTWLADATRLRFVAGMITSMMGFAAVVSSAAIYRIPAKPIWNSGWVVASFIGTTLTISGIAALACTMPVLVCSALVLAGSALVLLSAMWMWPPLRRLPLQPAWLRPWFFANVLLAIPLPLVMITVPLAWGTSLAVCAAVLGMFSGRMLMFAASTLETQF